MILLLLFIVLVSSIKRNCTPRDFRIHAARSKEFKSLFRTFGGLWTTRTGYIDKIVEHVGFSHACASCYGDAYICGFDACPWVCRKEGTVCDQCLERNACISNCNKCTGIPY